jgi:hypothetical protein
MDRFAVLTKVIRDRRNRAEHHVVYSYLQFYGTPLNIDSRLFPCYKLNQCVSRLHCSFIYQVHGASRATIPTKVGLYIWKFLYHFVNHAKNSSQSGDSSRENRNFFFVC